MQKRKSAILSLFALLCFSCGGSSDKPLDGGDYYVCAYVWPSCHDDSLAHQYLWPQGNGEWEIIQKGNPRFPGHYQPKQPLWGYEHDDDPTVVEKWIDTALEHGVNTFVYDWYWFMGYPFLEGALDNGFLKARNNQKMNFYLMWANHQVKKNYWNCHLYGNDTSILFDPRVDWEQYQTIVHRVIHQYFKRENYLKIDGKPVFCIYDMDKFIGSFGTLDEASRAMEYFREEVRRAGFPGLHLQESAGGGYYLSEEAIAVKKERIEKLGICSHAFYNMGGNHRDYLVHGTIAADVREKWDKCFDIPLFPTVSIGWDPTPRFPTMDESAITCFHQTPIAFESFLMEAKDYADRHPDQPPFIMINAWNEWVEGSYLLPDRYYGFGYLEAVKHVFKTTQ